MKRTGVSAWLGVVLLGIAGGCFTGCGNFPRPLGAVRSFVSRSKAACRNGTLSDCTVAVDMDPLSLLCRLAALVPALKFHVIREPAQAELLDAH